VKISNIKYQISNWEGGQSLFEVVVSLAISALVIVVLVSLVSNAVRNASYSKNNSLAAFYGQQATEWLRGQRDSNIAEFETNVLTPSWCLTDLQWTLSRACSLVDVIANTLFTRQVNFSISTVNGKSIVQADVIVSWEDSQGTHEVVNSTNYADWRQR